jgi:hypothetical protein
MALATTCSGSLRPFEQRKPPTPTKPQGLRLHDNPALLAACEGAQRVYPIFIIDPNFLQSSNYKCERPTRPPRMQLAATAGRCEILRCCTVRTPSPRKLVSRSLTHSLTVTAPTTARVGVNRYSFLLESLADLDRRCPVASGAQQRGGHAWQPCAPLGRPVPRAMQQLLRPSMHRPSFAARVVAPVSLHPHSPL